MDGLCTACLCTGRNLHNIADTDFYDLYTQILNEIPYAEGVSAARLCWECRATMRRFRQFKTRVQSAHLQLMHLRHLDEASKQALIASEPSLVVEHVIAFSYPDIKLEVEVDCLVKTELDEEHCEPETFVNELQIEQTISLTEEDIKPIKEKKKKPKVKKKKKVPNKSKKKIEQEVPVEQNVLESDAESAREYENDVEDRIEESVNEDIIDVKEFKCSDCDVLFEVKSELEKHVELKHQPSKPKLVKEPKPRAVRRARRGDQPERPECFECGKVFSSRKTYRYHLNVLHKGQNRYPCPRCGKIYQWKSNLGRHMRSHKARDSGELYCALCDKRFASVATYRQHLRVSRRHVPESQFSYICHECDKKFVSKTRLRDHIDWEHLNNIKFRCSLCNKPFKCHTSLYVHMQNVHRNKEKKENLCHVCGKSYQNAAKLKYHIVAMHTSETPYQCEQCNAAFGWYSSLYRHVREVHYKVPKKTKKSKKLMNEPPPMPLPPLHELHLPIP